ncbi:MAG: AI-2E family transporter [Pirellula sp.]|jgi:predicted PurR-regulated permease PerM|nr:AI-2E family transporter [Pirellula sp.]
MNPSDNESARGDQDWASPKNIRTAFFLLSTLLGTYLCYRIAMPFLPSLTWAIGLAVLATPCQRWLETKIGYPGLCSLMCTSLLAIVVVIPSSLAIQQLLIQASSGAALIEEKIQSGEWRQVFSPYGELPKVVQRLENVLDLPAIAKMITSSLSGAAMHFIRDSVYQFIDFGLTFYILFFLLRDRVHLLETMNKFLPLSGPQRQTMYQRVNHTINATVYGSFVVSAIQGTLLGLVFWFLDLPAPFLWGVIMACLALAPLVGAMIVWGPAAIFLALGGDWGKGVVLVIVGVLVIVVVDNLLRPALIGKSLHSHTALVFISVVGGMLFFGPSGVLIGPIVLTVTQVLLELNTPDLTPVHSKLNNGI